MNEDLFDSTSDYLELEKTRNGPDACCTTPYIIRIKHDSRRQLPIVYLTAADPYNYNVDNLDIYGTKENYSNSESLSNDLVLRMLMYCLKFNLSVVPKGVFKDTGNGISIRKENIEFIHDKCTDRLDVNSLEHRTWKITFA